MSRVSLYLGNYYAASQLGQGNPAFVEQSFRDLAAADNDFRQEAETHLASLTDQLTKRCYVSKVHRDILRKVLHG